MKQRCCIRALRKYSNQTDCCRCKEGIGRSGLLACRTLQGQAVGGGDISLLVLRRQILCWLTCFDKSTLNIIIIAAADMRQVVAKHEFGHRFGT